MCHRNLPCLHRRNDRRWPPREISCPFYTSKHPSVRTRRTKKRVTLNKKRSNSLSSPRHCSIIQSARSPHQVISVLTFTVELSRANIDRKRIEIRTICRITKKLRSSNLLKSTQKFSEMTCLARSKEWKSL